MAKQANTPKRTNSDPEMVEDTGSSFLQHTVRFAKSRIFAVLTPILAGLLTSMHTSYPLRGEVLQAI